MAEFRHTGLLVICSSILGLIVFIILNIKYIYERYPEKGFIISEWIAFIAVHIVVLIGLYVGILIRKGEKEYYTYN